MKLWCTFLALCLLLRCLLATKISTDSNNEDETVISLSVAYTTIAHYSLKPQASAWFAMKTCSNVGVQAYEVVINLPLTQWKDDSGPLSACVFGSNNSGCSTTPAICKQNKEGSVAFLTLPEFTSYLVRIENILANESVTFSMNIISAKPHLAAPAFELKPYGEPSVCPSFLRPLQRVVESGQVQIVSTSLSNAARYSFSVCALSNETSPAVAYTAVAASPSSAFSTYLCRSSPCNPSSSFISDRSGSAFNSLTFQSDSTNPQLGVYVQGWGQFNGTNDFVFLFEIQDQASDLQFASRFRGREILSL